MLDQDLTGLIGPPSDLGKLLNKVNACAYPTRVVGFNKSAERNWTVGWHQDRIIAVKDRAPVPGYGNWSCKGRLWHCEPPVHVLQRMLFVRVHLDDSQPEGGDMEIALNSHVHGTIRNEQADRVAVASDVELCTANRGDVLVLPMLTLHCSRPARKPTNRRVLRIDYACEPLPAPLEWALAH